MKMHIQTFESFDSTLKKEIRKRKKKSKPGETDSYDPPKYLVQPAKGDTGFFLVKAAFEKRKKRFDTGIFY